MNRAFICYEVSTDPQSHRQHLMAQVRRGVLAEKPTLRYLQRIAHMGDHDFLVGYGVVPAGDRLPRNAVPFAWIDESGMTSLELGAHEAELLVELLAHR